MSHHGKSVFNRLVGLVCEFETNVSVPSSSSSVFKQKLSDSKSLTDDADN